MSSRVFAVKLTPTWVELRVGDEPPTLVTDTITINFYDKVAKLVKSTTKVDAFGIPLVEFKEVEKKVPYKLSQTSVKGGNLLCTIRSLDLRRLRGDGYLSYKEGGTPGVEEFTPTSAKLLLDPHWRASYLPSAY